MDVFKYSTKIQRPQAFKTNSKGLLPECSVSTRDPEQRRLKLKRPIDLVYESTDHMSCLPKAILATVHFFVCHSQPDLASFPGTRKIGGSAWYTLFAHASSLFGNLHTVHYTNHGLAKQSC